MAPVTPVPPTGRSRALCALLAGTLLSSCYASYTAATPSELHGFDQLADALEVFRIAHAIPGVSAAIGENGHIAWSQGFGYADREEQRPVDPQTSFQIASV